ncbi:CBL-interacting protein kinase 5 [Capsicum baccatum]|uniref:CBL-interacting protein kinase 5 n=1 Tax=Capsicum baccatum TaxID=33114 RepID=A0A2G2VB85_CAPBA|nr:CBL-interacting protein kinase 5 [Capsicum baccatum]
MTQRANSINNDAYFFECFDIIYLFPDFVLSNLVDKDKSYRSDARFTTQNSASTIVSRLEEIASMGSFKVLFVGQLAKLYGPADPVAHLRRYCNQLRGAGGKEELLMAYFRESLSGLDSEWFVDQDIDKWNSWDDLDNEFMQQI